VTSSRRPAHHRPDGACSRLHLPGRSGPKPAGADLTGLGEAIGDRDAVGFLARAPG